jgi:hypothetical protein
VRRCATGGEGEAGVPHDTSPTGRGISGAKCSPHEAARP